MRLKPNYRLLSFVGLFIFLLIGAMCARTVFASHHKAQIAFVSTRDGNSEIYVMDADGNNQIRLTNHPERDYQPSWSPDGGRIVFSSNRNGGNSQVYVMDSNGKNVRRLTAGISDGKPAWSPDGQLIAFVSERNVGFRSQIHLMTADGEYIKQLSDLHLEKDVDPDWLNPGLLPVLPNASHATIWGRLKKFESQFR